MHAAPLTSERLQRVLGVLSDREPHSTLDIFENAGVCAVSACVAELRTHGAEITCARTKMNGGWVYFYTMLKGPTPS